MRESATAHFTAQEGWPKLHSTVDDPWAWPSSSPFVADRFGMNFCLVVAGDRRIQARLDLASIAELHCAVTMAVIFISGFLKRDKRDP